MTLIEELKEETIGLCHSNAYHPLAQYDNGYLDGLERAIEIVEHHSDWIPATVSNIPHKEVICCDSCGEEMFGWIFQDEESETGLRAESEGVFMYNVVAWMPKPKPYEGEINNE